MSRFPGSSGPAAPGKVPQWDTNELMVGVRANLQRFIDDATFCDVRFEIGPDDSSKETFYGISALFAVQSTVFEAQLFGGSV